MTTRYQKSQIEDVARILSGWTDPQYQFMFRCLAKEFAGLFAADNPPRCYIEGNHECDDGCMVAGFDRKQFLAACGLEGPWNEAVDGLADSIDGLRARK